MVMVVKRWGGEGGGGGGDGGGVNSSPSSNVSLGQNAIDSKVPGSYVLSAMGTLALLRYLNEF